MISAPSILVYLLAVQTSAPLSLPARSINDIFPIVLFLHFSSNWRIACEREEFAFAPVDPETRIADPTSIIYNTEWIFMARLLVIPIILTFSLPSILRASCFLSFRRSYNFPQ